MVFSPLVMVSRLGTCRLTRAMISNLSATPLASGWAGHRPTAARHGRGFIQPEESRGSRWPACRSMASCTQSSMGALRVEAERQMSPASTACSCRTVPSPGSSAPCHRRASRMLWGGSRILSLLRHQPKVLDRAGGGGVERAIGFEELDRFVIDGRVAVVGDDADCIGLLPIRTPALAASAK